MTPSPRARFLPAAERDVDDIAEYIARDSLDSALRFYAAVRSDAQKLADMPGLGPIYGFKSAGHADIRFWPVAGFRNHLMFYRPAPDGVEVIRVIHGARDLQRQMQNPT